LGLLIALVQFHSETQNYVLSDTTTRSFSRFEMVCLRWYGDSLWTISTTC